MGPLQSPVGEVVCLKRTQIAFTVLLVLLGCMAWQLPRLIRRQGSSSSLPLRWSYVSQWSGGGPQRFLPNGSLAAAQETSSSSSLMDARSHTASGKQEGPTPAAVGVAAPAPPTEEPAVTAESVLWPRRLPMDRPGWPEPDTVRDSVRRIHTHQFPAPGDKPWRDAHYTKEYTPPFVSKLHYPLEVVGASQCYGTVVLDVPRNSAGQCVGFDAAKMRSEDPVYDAWIKSRAGPDAFDVVVTDLAGNVSTSSGTAMWDEPACGYIVEFEVTTAVANVTIRWTQGNYESMDDLIAQQTVQDVLPAPVATYTVKCPIRTAAVNNGTAPSRICDRNDSFGFPGRWIAANLSSSPLNTLAAGSLPVNPAERFPTIHTQSTCIAPPFSHKPEWFGKCMQTLSAGKQVLSARSGNNITNNNTDDGDQPVAKKFRILFTGDSQVRFFYFRLVNDLALPSDAGGSSQRSVDFDQRNWTEVGKTWIADFKWDPWFDKRISDLTYLKENYDLVVGGIAAWPRTRKWSSLTKVQCQAWNATITSAEDRKDFERTCPGKHSITWNMTRFTQRITDIADRVVKPFVNTYGGKFVWVGAPPRPLRAGTWHRVTNNALGVCSTIGARKFTEVGGQHLDYFGFTQPNVHLHKGDYRHFGRGTVMHSLVDALLTMVCPTPALSTQ